MEPSWLETYYTALEFVYWEPQHLGRKKNPETDLDTLDKVAKRLRHLEVTLNHNIDQFFRLAPSLLRRELFARVFGRTFSNLFIMHGREVDKTFELVYAMQPDFLFVSEKEVVSIEMKTGAKSSVSQVLKYALLGLAIELKQKVSLQHYLLLLGPGDFSGLWNEKFKTTADLHDAISNANLPAFLDQQPVRFRSHQEQFAGVVGRLQISWLTYGQLSDFLRAASPAETDLTQGAEVYRKLISGLLGELSARNLDK